MAHCKYNTSGVSTVACDHPLEDWKDLVSPLGFLSSTKRPVGLSTASTTEPVTPRVFTPASTFECPPSPGLTRRLLASAQTRKRAGRHTLDVPASLLRLTPPPAIDRSGIPGDVFLALTSRAREKRGQHKLVRRRTGLSGEVHSVLILQEKCNALLRHISTTSTSSVYSPDPSMF